MGESLGHGNKTPVFNPFCHTIFITAPQMSYENFPSQLARLQNGILSRVFISMTSTSC